VLVSLLPDTSHHPAAIDLGFDAHLHRPQLNRREAAARTEAAAAHLARQRQRQLQDAAKKQKQLSMADREAQKSTKEA